VERFQADAERARRLGLVVPECLERRAILGALQDFKQNKTHAARALGISLKTLHNKLKRYASEVVT